MLSLMLTRGLRIATGLGIALLVARLGPEAMGLHGWVLALGQVMAFVAGLGLPGLLVRSVAQRPTDATPLLQSALLVLLPSTLIAGLMMVGWAWAWGGDSQLLVLVGLGAIALGFDAVRMALGAVFHGLRETHLETRGVAVGRVMYGLLAVGSVYLGAGLAGILGAQAMGLAIGAVWLLATAWGRLGPLDLREGTRGVGALLFNAQPFALNVLAGTLYLTIDVIMLKEMRSPEELGWYRLAALLGIQLPILAQILNDGMYPALSRAAKDGGGVSQALSMSVRLSLAVSIPIAVGGVVLAEPLTLLLGGSAEYLPAALAMAVLLLMLPFRFVNNGLGTALSALDHQSERTSAVVMAAAFNVVANAIVIPVWGYVGAAATTLLTDALLLALFWWRVRAVVPTLSVLTPACRALVPALLMGLVVAMSPPWHVLIRIALGVGVAVPLLLLSGSVDRNDWARLRAL